MPYVSERRGSLPPYFASISSGGLCENSLAVNKEIQERNRESGSVPADLVLRKHVSFFRTKKYFFLYMFFAERVNHVVQGSTSFSGSTDL